MDSFVAEGTVKDKQDKKDLLEQLHNHPLVLKPDMWLKPDMCHAPLDRQVVDDGYQWGSFHKVVQLHQWGSSEEQLQASKHKALLCTSHHHVLPPSSSSFSDVSAVSSKPCFPHSNHLMKMNYLMKNRIHDVYDVLLRVQKVQETFCSNLCSTDRKLT